MLTTRRTRRPERPGLRAPGLKPDSGRRAIALAAAVLAAAGLAACSSSSSSSSSSPSSGTSSSSGAALVVADLALTTELNGLVMQSARTSQMLVDVPSSIEFFSSFTTLRPGDVIATGTPAGVGFARHPPVWLQPGDVIEITIEGIGTIRNRVVAEEGDRSDWRWRPNAFTGGL